MGQCRGKEGFLFLQPSELLAHLDKEMLSSGRDKWMRPYPLTSQLLLLHSDVINPSWEEPKSALG